MDKRIYTGYVYTCGQQMSCYLRTMERIFIRFTGNSNKEDLAFSERVTGRSRAVEIFWKYANYQLVSFLWHCAGFYDRYDCLLSSRFTLSRAFVPCSFVPLCPGFQACSSTFSCLCTKRDATPFTFFFLQFEEQD